MSDFFDMRESFDLIQKQKKLRKKRLRSRVIQAAAVVVLGTTLGVKASIDKLEKPVGSVSKTYCQTEKACIQFEIIVKG